MGAEKSPSIAVKTSGRAGGKGWMLEGRARWRGYRWHCYCMLRDMRWQLRACKEAIWLAYTPCTMMPMVEFRCLTLGTR